MILTEKTLAEFADQIKAYEEGIQSATNVAEADIADRDRLEFAEMEDCCEELKREVAIKTGTAAKTVSSYTEKIERASADDILSKGSLLDRLGICETWIVLFTGIRHTLNTAMTAANPTAKDLLNQLYITQKDSDELEKMPSVTIDSVLSGKLEVSRYVLDACGEIHAKWNATQAQQIKLPLRVRLKRRSAGGNIFFRILYKIFDTDFMRFMMGDEPKMPVKSDDNKINYVTLYGICVEALDLLLPEKKRILGEIAANVGKLDQDYRGIVTAGGTEFEKAFKAMITGLDDAVATSSCEYRSSRAKTKSVYISSNDFVASSAENLSRDFTTKFSPESMAEEYEAVLALEPVYESFKCRTEMASSVALGSISTEAELIGCCELTLRFLKRNYFYFLHCNDVRFPYVVPFTSDFNYLYRMSGDYARDNSAVLDARNIGMRLFSMLPPGKLVMTFFDPVKNGDSFALFNQLVSTDDRTSRVINGKAWTLPSDIEEKLRILTDHISNVTQRCLQGKYNNIFEYNTVAEQNAEPYQVLMMMDFPAGLSQNAMKLLEQVVTSGPKCGVFTILYRNESQYNKLDERSHPLVNNIESNLTPFDYSEDGSKVVMSGGDFCHTIRWKARDITDKPYFDSIVSTLKDGIKNADRVSIDIKKLGDDDGTDSARNGIRIPIGLHGANELQYLTLGVGGSHHALIAGSTGSGKSTLLHTIIIRTLMKYSPDEVVIYLVDFKRGVEFKVYADYVLPSFRVIAIESEREFGHNILKAIEREQKIRAAEFRRHQGVDEIEDYREMVGKMPRILVIMDEFQELFAGSNDEISKDCSVLLERIVRQGRGFGVHLILSTQSYSNISGIDRSVYDQMAVRIVLKCSASDANLMLDGGSTEVDQISNNDPGRAIYNSEAGNKEYNSHFRVARVSSKDISELLQGISERTVSYFDPKHTTRVLLSNIEDNKYSFFGRFDSIDYTDEQPLGKLYIGETMGVDENMQLCFVREDFSNLLLMGNDPDMARNIFTFAMLSLCINYWLRYHRKPEKPIITFYNVNPLDDSYFVDTAELLGKLLPDYIHYISRGDDKSMEEMLSEFYEVLPSARKAARSESSFQNDVMSDWFSDPRSEEGPTEVEEQKTEVVEETVEEVDIYLFVLGYQNADILKAEQRRSGEENIGSLFNMSGGYGTSDNISLKEMFGSLLREGAQVGIHTVLWHDSYEAFSQDDNNMVSYFNLRIAFSLSDVDYSRFVNANNVKMNEQNNAIYYNKHRSNQIIRPYQAPIDSWLESICSKLK